MIAFGSCVPGSSGEQWWEQRGRHFREEMCRPDAACWQPFNDANLITEPVVAFDQLIHGASLNAMLWRLARYPRPDSSWRGEFYDLVGLPVPDRLPGEWTRSRFAVQVDAVAEALQERGEGSVQQLAALLCRALGDSQPPWFACFAEEVEDLIAESDGSRLCAALGLGHLEEGEWLFLWRYKVGWVRPLYRPTVVIANDSPYHYPSPPGYAFGITMPLADDLPACREVIHNPLRAPLTRDSCLDRLFRLESAPTIGDTERSRLRRAHRERLSMEYDSDGTRAWRERHDEAGS